MHFLTICVLALFSTTAFSQSLQERFDNPPPEARPVTWWHWMNGNVTKEGITRDLEWMARIGLGGPQIFETGQVNLPGQAVHLSPYWQDCVRHAIAECARLGLEFGMHNCSGWNNSGGPWVDPADSMKKLTFSRSVVTGPAPHAIAPPAPPATKIYPFSYMNHMNASLKRWDRERTDYTPWRTDIAVLAFPASEEVIPPMRELQPEVEPAGDAALLWDGDEFTGIDLEKARTDDSRDGALRIRFSDPKTLRAIYLLTGEGGIPCREIVFSAEDPQGQWQAVKTFEMPLNGGPLRESHGVSFDPVTASGFELRFVDIEKSKRPHELRELELYGEARIEAWPVKAGFLRGRGEQDTANPTEVAAENHAVAVDQVIDLTDRLRLDGTLDWQVPEGRWTVLRVGATSTGKTNHPSAIGGVGLEVDKFDRDALGRFIKNGPMQKVVDLAGEQTGKALKSFGTDSWEVGAQNWTPQMRTEFQRRRGYDPLPWMPALSGQVVQNVELTERFLWDWRRTISDLFAEHFYGSIQEFCHRHGMKSFAEPYNNGNYNNLEMGGFVDDVAPVFWTDGRRFSESNIREMASLANTYGLPRVESEAYTSMADDAMWRQHPRKMKALGDAAFAYGVNRYVFHTSAHQPWNDVVPGMTMGPFGINFTRTTTWAEQAAPWIAYITRCQSVLQTGRYVADALFFIGEGSPNAFTTRRDKLDIAEGYGFDGCDARVLLERATVEGGDIVLRSGMRYRFLVLPQGEETMTLPLAEKLLELVHAGATVLVQTVPKRSPSLTGYPENDGKLQSTLAELMGGLDGQTVKEHALGKGRVIRGFTPAQWLEKLNIVPSHELLEAPSEATVRAIHRIDDKTDFFFIAFENSQPGQVEIALRASGRTPELWNPLTGARQLARKYREENGRTIVSLDFQPDDSVFVVFPAEPTTTLTERAQPVVVNDQSLAGPWRVEFQPKRGAPEFVELTELIDLAQHTEEGVRYFSGTASWFTEFSINTPPTGATGLALDLGQVEVIAEVILNGKNLGVLWKSPYRVDIRDAVVPGTNKLEVRVTNLWPNRIIGDERQYPQKNNFWWARDGSWPEWLDHPEKSNPTGRITFVIWPHWKAQDELLPSGLIGPVRLLTEEPGQ